MRLEGQIRRWIGDSTERKPRPGLEQADGTTPSAADMLPGSSFLESDTGVVWRWDGDDWRQPEPDVALLLAVQEQTVQLVAVRRGLERVLEELTDEPVDLLDVPAGEPDEDEEAG